MSLEARLKHLEANAASQDELRFDYIAEQCGWDPNLFEVRRFAKTEDYVMTEEAAIDWTPPGHGLVVIRLAKTARGLARELERRRLWSSVESSPRDDEEESAE